MQQGWPGFSAKKNGFESCAAIVPFQVHFERLDAETTCMQKYVKFGGVLVFNRSGASRYGQRLT